MKTLLSIQSSIYSDEGQSGRLSAAFISDWQQRNPGGRVWVRNLAETPLPHLTAERFNAFVTDPDERTLAQRRVAAESDRLIAEFDAADEVVLGLPMYNFTIPSTLKAWFDHVARAGVTFRYTEFGPEGLLRDRPVHILATRGGRYAGTEADTQTGLVRQFFGLLGITDLRFTYAEGLSMGDQERLVTLSQAEVAMLENATRAA